ncbi:TIR domain-containing protein [Methylobacterium brachiatum]|uniref:TIR domain-containing protein n=1 Tax=Methylobacterium brachiatum TaxID=269660 RepID=A0ABV1R481_9HYPH
MSEAEEPVKFETTFGRDKYYDDVRFSYEAIRNLMKSFGDKLAAIPDEIRAFSISFDENGQNYSFKNPKPAHMQRAVKAKFFSVDAYSGTNKRYLSIRYSKNSFRLSMDGFLNERDLDDVFYILDARYAESKIAVGEALKDVTIFIGHGRSKLWRDLKDHLQDMHHFKVEAYETGARAGYNIQDILLDMSTRASMALLVHTGEDIDREGKEHARENVVHETGLFQGKLGFRRAIVLLEDGTNEFSNIAGLQQLRFQKGNIKEIFGDVVATIKREFTPR